MENENLIPLHQLCRHYNIEFSFIESLDEFGLVRITTIDETRYIYSEQIQPLEKMIRLHYDLDINLEGIEAISHLLEKLDSLQEELRITRNRLTRFEQDK
ncbi:MAG: chaperone modulator CbpM [Bacteroidetes bacterium]|nr:chaperone modulator CbpM [Bacteroidota bacterium]